MSSYFRSFRAHPCLPRPGCSPSLETFPSKTRTVLAKLGDDNWRGTCFVVWRLRSLQVQWENSNYKTSGRGFDRLRSRASSGPCCPTCWPVHGAVGRWIAKPGLNTHLFYSVTRGKEALFSWSLISSCFRSCCSLLAESIRLGGCCHLLQLWPLQVQVRHSCIVNKMLNNSKCAKTKESLRAGVTAQTNLNYLLSVLFPKGLFFSPGL